MQMALASDFSSMLAPCGSILDPFWLHFGPISGPCGLHLGPLEPPLGSILVLSAPLWPLLTKSSIWARSRADYLLCFGPNGVQSGGQMSDNNHGTFLKVIYTVLNICRKKST